MQDSFRVTNNFSVGDPSASHSTPQEWFNPAAFAKPTQYTFGNSRRNVLRAQGLAELDATLKKNFALKSERDLEFRFEGFNVANHSTFSAPNATIGSSSAGIVTSTLNSNRILQAVLKLIF